MCSIPFKELRKKRAWSTEPHWKKQKEEWVIGQYIVFASVSVYFLLEETHASTSASFYFNFV